MALTDKLTAIGDAIRAKTETTDLIPLAEMPNEVDVVFWKGHAEGWNEGHDVGYEGGLNDGYAGGYEDGHATGYNEGKQAEYDRFWDGLQDYGNRASYGYAFLHWGADYIRPKYKIVPTAAGGASQILAHCKKLKKIESAFFDFSQKPTGTNNDSGYYYSFYNCNQLEEIEDVGLIPQHNYNAAFASCSALHTIAKIGVNENTKFSETFNYCPKLQNITIEGVIGQNGIDVHWSTQLTHASLMSIINALKTFTDGTTKTVTLGTTNLAKLTDEEKAIATQKGWTLA